VARKKNTRSANTSEFLFKPAKEGVPLKRANAAMVRIAHPSLYGYYYNDKDSVNPWVTKGYTIWKMSDWEGRFGNSVSTKEQGSRYLDDSNRLWEFFGYNIPLYDPGDKT
jgi:hypothetical protein